MQDVKKTLLAVFAVLALAAAMTAINVTSARLTAAEKVVAGDHWRHFDGHWSYWHEADHRWYYTDGVHWYYHDGAGWLLYQFDKLFGRAGFVHGEYKVPPEHVKVVVPRHEVVKHR
jgi:hypothetical protein